MMRRKELEKLIDTWGDAFDKALDKYENSPTVKNHRMLSVASKVELVLKTVLEG